MVKQVSEHRVLRKAGRSPTFADTKTILGIFRDLDKSVLNLPSQSSAFYRDQVHAIEQLLGIPDHDGWYSKGSVDRVVDYFMEHHYSDNGDPVRPRNKKKEQPKEERPRRSMLEQTVDNQTISRKFNPAPQERPSSSTVSPLVKPRSDSSDQKVDQTYGFSIYQHRGQQVVLLEELFRTMRSLDRQHGWSVLSPSGYKRYLARFFNVQLRELAIYHREIAPADALEFLPSYLHLREEDITETTEERARRARALEEIHLVQAILQKRKHSIPLDDLERKIADGEPGSASSLYRVVLGVDLSSYEKQDVAMPVLRGKEIHVRWYYTPNTLEPVQNVVDAVDHALPVNDSQRSFARYLEPLITWRYLSHSAGMPGYVTPEILFHFFSLISSPSQQLLKKEIIDRLRPMMNDRTRKQQRRPDPLQQFHKVHKKANVVSYSQIVEVMRSIDIFDGRSMSSRQYYHNLLDDARTSSAISDANFRVYTGERVVMKDALDFLRNYRARMLSLGKNSSS